MGRTESRVSTNAFVAFGQRLSPGDAFEDLVAGRGWQRETWLPTFVEARDRAEIAQARQGERSLARDQSWEDRQLLRLPGACAGESQPVAGKPEPRLLVASANELPTLYFAEWHYIDFVLSCVGNVSEAARVLGIRRSTLQRKRKKAPPDR
jgi:hypothetical protein